MVAQPQARPNETGPSADELPAVAIQRALEARETRKRALPRPSAAAEFGKSARALEIAELPGSGQMLAEIPQKQAQILKDLGFSEIASTAAALKRGLTTFRTRSAHQITLLKLLKDGRLAGTPSLLALEGAAGIPSFEFFATPGDTRAIAQALHIPIQNEISPTPRLVVPATTRLLSLLPYAAPQSRDTILPFFAGFTAASAPADYFLLPPFLTYAAEIATFFFVSHPDAGLNQVLPRAGFKYDGHGIWQTARPIAAHQLAAFADPTLAFVLEAIYNRWPFVFDELSADAFQSLVESITGKRAAKKKDDPPPRLSYEPIHDAFATSNAGLAYELHLDPLPKAPALFGTTDFNRALALRDHGDDNAEAEILARLVIAAAYPAVPADWQPPIPSAPHNYDLDQIDAIRHAMRGPVIIIEDDAGFGKSYEAAGVLDSLTHAEPCPASDGAGTKFFLYILPAKERDKISNLLARIPSQPMEIRRLDKIKLEEPPANIVTVSADIIATATSRYPAVVVLISYETAAASQVPFERTWDGVIFDESHKVKNIESTIGGTLIGHSNALGIKARKYVLMSGTQFTDTMADYWPLLRLVLGDQVTPLKRFKKIYAYDKKNPDNTPIALTRIARLSEAIDSGIRLRRTKEERKLTPGKRPAEIIEIETDDPKILLAARTEGELFENYQTTTDGKEKNEIKRRINQLRKLTGHAKLPAIAKVLAVDAADHPIIVFAYHTDIADAFGRELQNFAPRKLRIAVIHGKNASPGQRAAIERQFQAGAYDAIVTTLDASALGADYNISWDASIIELDWKMHHVAQAIERADRRGQTELVRQRYWIIRGSFDDYSTRNITSKSRVAAIANGDDRRALARSLSLSEV